MARSNIYQRVTQNHALVTKPFRKQGEAPAEFGAGNSVANVFRNYFRVFVENHVIVLFIEQ